MCALWCDGRPAPQDRTTKAAWCHAVDVRWSRSVLRRTRAPVTRCAALSEPSHRCPCHTATMLRQRTTVLHAFDVDLVARNERLKPTRCGADGARNLARKMPLTRKPRGEPRARDGRAASERAPADR